MWFEWNQNNSGGSFIVDDEVCHRLFIEADTYEDAERKAFELGIYYHGCYSGQDCPCCGDRWYEGGEVEAPDIEEYAQALANEYGWTTPDARIFYKNGKIKEVFTQKT